MRKINENNKSGFRNFIGADPYINSLQRGNQFSRACGLSAYNSCCGGLAANGDNGETPVETVPEPVEVKNKVQNIITLQHAKTALAIIGLYVVVMFAYKKIKK